MTSSTETPEAPKARAALRQRLRAAAIALTDDGTEFAGSSPDDIGALLDMLVRSLHNELSTERLWLLWTAVASAFPTADELLDALRFFELSDARESAIWLLARCLRSARRSGSPARGMRLVERGVVVDVDYSARHDLHTGIQRVVRTTLPRWDREHAIVPVAWTTKHGAFRTLRDNELHRVFNWTERLDKLTSDAALTNREDGELVVPWKSLVVLVEVPARETCGPLAAIAQFSGNDVVAIGYDCVPIVSADTVPTVESTRFVRYLTVVKHTRRIAAISDSARGEFQGFANMLPLQGIAGPTVVECQLPGDAGAGTRNRRMSDEPLVVCVGSFEPRKNQAAVLYAAEALWREGLEFRLRFIGGGGTDTAFASRLRELQATGRPVTADTAIGETELMDAYREARFTVFVSTHEGYGLPVAESLALGVPVITTNYGSTSEISRDGGTILVDPRDDEELRVAMRELLVDDDRLRQLLTEIGTRPERSWDDYARDLWAALVEPRSPIAPAPHRSGAEA